jgi:virginiamycin A acetyltransferase
VACGSSEGEIKRDMLALDNKLKQKLAGLYLRFLPLRFGSVYIARGSRIRSDIYMGTGSRFTGSATIKGQGKLVVGKYCAIGDNVRIITSNHDVNYINMQYNLQRRIGVVMPASKADTVVIGNNVWIGDSAIILPGAEIGDGAVIGSGSVVTKKLDDFCIYAGNPARFIRCRFDEETLKEIKKLDWWNWDLQKIMEHKEIFSDTVSNKMGLIRRIARKSGGQLERQD